MHQGIVDEVGQQLPQHERVNKMIPDFIRFSDDVNALNLCRFHHIRNRFLNEAA